MTRACLRQPAAPAAAAWLFLVSAALNGCAAVQPYSNHLEKNLEIRTESAPKVRTSVDVYRLDAACSGKYQGTIMLDRPVVFVGIPPNEPSYLVFEFASSSFMGGSRSVVAYDTVLDPRGQKYNIEVRYVDNMYDVRIREAEKRGRVIERKELSVCRSR